MNTKKLVWGIGITIVGLGLLFVYYYLNIYLPNHPAEPIASGQFPQNPIWVFEAFETNEAVVSTPVAWNSMVFIRTTSTLYALDGMNGAIIWTTSSPAPASLSIAPQISGNYLIVPETGSRIAGYALETGEQLWNTVSIEAREDQKSSPVKAITASNDLFFAARYNLNLIAYRTEKNLELLWERYVPGRSSLYLTANDETVYLGASHFLRAYDASYGNLLWEREFDALVGPILGDADKLYLTLFENDSSIVALDPDSGAEIWSIARAEIEEDEFRYLTIIDDVLYVSGKKLIAIDKISGSVIWMSEKTDWLGQPVLLSDKLYARNTGTTLFAFDYLSGEILGNLIIQADTPMKHDPERGSAVIGDLLVVPFGDNRVFAYKP